ncbi:MAG: hypothetical protein KY476_17140 [Planctomycetes bacterium]|nr:hypothetical protein [Planctomycetota bacterium]
MRGILADVNCEGQVSYLVALLRSGYRQDFWDSMNLEALRFKDVALNSVANDVDVWNICQNEGLVLITGNRKEDESHSLENAIAALNGPD